MSSQIGLISDVHATAGPLREALAILERKSVDRIICTGDIAGYGNQLNECIELLIDSNCLAILGNHDVWYSDRHIGTMDQPVAAFFHNLPITWQATITGKRIFAVHASPPASMKRGITLLDQYGKIISGEKDQWELELEGYNYDILIVGHTHQVYAEYLGRILVINPGSTKFNNSCAILRLPEMEVSVFPLSGKNIRKIWHWGMTK